MGSVARSDQGHPGGAGCAGRDPGPAGGRSRRAAHPVHARALLRGGTVLRGVRPGLRRSRDRALVQCTEGFVIAAVQPPSNGVSPARVFEFVVAALLLLGAIRSLVTWFRTDFDAVSAGERVLFAVQASARVGTWLAFAAVFLGYAVVSEPQGLWWFAIVPLALAGVQLLTGAQLSRPRGGATSAGARVGGGVSDGEGGKAPTMAAERPRPGSLEPEKHGETADPGHPQPDAAEVESARVLANEARGD